MKKKVNNNEEISYREFLEKIKIEFSDWLRLAEAGGAVKNTALSARKKSIQMRKLLKTYREISIRNDKRNDKILKEAKEQIKKELL